MSVPKLRRRTTNGLVTRNPDSPCLEFVHNKVEHERHAMFSTRQCEIQILAILCQQTSVSLAQLCRLTKFNRVTIEQAIARLIRQKECSLAGTVILRASV
jgi:hypothetical protein